MSTKAAVDHTYYDYSRYIQSGGQLKTEEKKASNNFPAKLHEILSEQSLNGIISWMVSWYDFVWYALISSIKILVLL